jgi:NitT/TauT family transport system ATP-binding protein
MLEIDRVSKVFVDRKRGEGFVAVRDLSLHIDEGELVCVVGPSGCGKSTLLNMIAGFDPPTRGRIIHDGREVISASPERAMVFQDPHLLPWMSAVENVEFVLRPSVDDPDERKERATKALRKVGLEDFARSRPAHLSGGQRQRVAIARALVMEPRILLMDEPFSNLDEVTRERLDREIRELWTKEGRTLIFVTHDLDEAVRLGDRVVCMDTSPGRLRGEWTIPEDQEASAEVRREISFALSSSSTVI